MLFRSTIHQQGKTIVLVTHDMDAVLEYATHVIVMHQGEVIAEGTPSEIFSDQPLLQRTGLQLPKVFAVVHALQARGVQLETTAITSIPTLVKALEVARRVQ